MAERKKRGKGKGRARLYWRERNGVSRAYGDFRDYGAYGGRFEALKPAGSKQATTVPDEAATLLAERLKVLEGYKLSHVILNVTGDDSLGGLVERHLAKKAEAKEVTPTWVGQARRHLDAACVFFEHGKVLGGPRVPRSMSSISAGDVRRYVDWLRKRETKREGREPTHLSDGTIRQYLWSLSNAFRRAQEEQIVPPEYNPVKAMLEKPRQQSAESSWLRVHEAALLLEAARLHKPTRTESIRCLHPLIATMLLTGGRVSEVMGLTVDDISFDRRTVTFRPLAHRRLKTKQSKRSVPLWPQLEEILRDYVFSRSLPHLLFPSAVDPDAMITDIRKSLDAIAVKCGWQRGDVRAKMFRHTYCSARLLTVTKFVRGYDKEGAPIHEYMQTAHVTVAKEMGHGGIAMVDRVYSHAEVHEEFRSEFVEYRVNQHREKLAERLPMLLLSTAGT